MFRLAARCLNRSLLIGSRTGLSSPIIESGLQPRILPFVLSCGNCSESNPSKFVLHARGLPYQARAEEILEFFKDCNVVNGEDGVHLVYNYAKKPTGECFVEFDTEDDLSRGLSKNREYIGSRYVLLKESNEEEMNAKLDNESSPTTVLRLRGVPFDCSQNDIINFFEGCEIESHGITLQMRKNGRPSGIAFVEFVSQEAAKRAMERDRERIGGRYIEIFPSSKPEVQPVQERRGFSTDRGGPFQRSEYDW